MISFPLIFVLLVSANSIPSTKRLALLKGPLWPCGRTIRVTYKHPDELVTQVSATVPIYHCCISTVVHYCHLFHACLVTNRDEIIRELSNTHGDAVLSTPMKQILGQSNWKFVCSVSAMSTVFGHDASALTCRSSIISIAIWRTGRGCEGTPAKL
jgi:hypothetical protein